jgi:predicted Rossmann fold nucleotide-binding protein DprA/Smf involved in DNA uptake
MDAVILPDREADDDERPAAVRGAGSPPSAAENGLSEQQQAIVGVLHDEPLKVDAIIDRTALPAQVVLQELTFLSLRGRVRRVDGQTYARK